MEWTTIFRWALANPVPPIVIGFLMVISVMGKIMLDMRKQLAAEKLQDANTKKDFRAEDRIDFAHVSGEMHTIVDMLQTQLNNVTEAFSSYRKEAHIREVELKEQLLNLKQRVRNLEKENHVLRKGKV